MSSKNHRAGRKMGGKHTTVIDAAKPIVDYFLKHPDVNSVVAGKLQMGIKAGAQRLKITEQSGCLFLKVRGSASIQEIRVFSKKIDQVKKDAEVKFKNILIKNM